MSNRFQNFIFSLLMGALILSGMAFAQALEELPEPPSEEEIQITTEILSNKAFEDDFLVADFIIPKSIPVGEKVLLDASLTTPASPSKGAITYSWEFGDNVTRPKWGEQIVHSYDQPGYYTVTLRAKQGDLIQTVQKDIIVYNTTAVLFTDKPAEFEQVIRQAGTEGVLLKIIPYASEFSASGKFVQALQANTEVIKAAQSFIFHEESLVAIQGFSNYWQQFEEEDQPFDPKERLWVQIYGSSLGKAAKIMKPVFKSLNPDSIVITREEALLPLFQTKQLSAYSEILRRRGIESVVITESMVKTPFIFFISNLTNYFITNGIPIDVVYLLFAVPFIAFVIAFARQFVGIATLGVYAPLMLTLSFMVLGLGFGFVVFLAVLLVSSLIRMLFEKVDLLYIPRVALLLSVLSLSFFLILGGAVHFEVSTTLSLSIFPMLVMATLSEKFLSAQSETGMRFAVIATIETVLISLAAYSLVEWGWLRTSVIARPEIIFIPMIGIVWLGRFTGLRLSEYFRFRALFKEDSAE